MFIIYVIFDSICRYITGKLLDELTEKVIKLDEEVKRRGDKK